ncbi:MAG: ChaN family lipoprotein [Thermoanaerobaculia bacterium]
MRIASSLFLVLMSIPLWGDPLGDFLRDSGKPPLEYLLARIADHAIVIAGEEHWRRDDAGLIAAAVPELRRRSVVLAMETLRAGSQADIDRLLNAAEWDAPAANAILRAADWPYVEYRDILRAAWTANRIAMDAPPLKILALGPPADFREQKIRYDESMAERIIALRTDDPARKVLVYCGMHHAFTRYLQVERMQRGRVTEFMQRMGNILWRRYGEDVFLIALHQTEMCGPAGAEERRRCLPFDGLVDCAAKRPVGFDLLTSPIAETKLPATSYYAAGHPLLRAIDYADGIIWTRPIDEVRMVTVIPLEEYAPDLASDAAEVEEWKKHAEYLAAPLLRPAWAGLAQWRSGCRD